VLDDASTVAIAGASLAGIRAAETLRGEGFGGRIVMIGAEEHLPYDRPPLSKQFLAGSWGVERLKLLAPEKIEALGLDMRLGRRACSLDPEGHRLVLDDGATVSFQGLVVATGAHPRMLPGAEAISGVHLLRTLEDSSSISARLQAPGTRVVVVGAGFIGSEVAATCHGRGAQVTILEMAQVPLEHALGAEMGAACASLHQENGVDLRTGVRVSSLRDGEVGLEDGSVLSADVVVVGIGVEPTTDWLETSGLELDDGVVADATLHAAEDVVVAGDLARWYEEQLGRHVRVEHWTNASEQGRAAARSLLAGADAKPYSPVPYFWSDQYDVKIQMLGHPSSEDEVVVVDGSVAERRFVSLYGRDGELKAALGFGRPRQLMQYRPLLERRATFEEALAHGL
jgi:3-phenylpropionate/trans-cinnamate dioxygenase ferredoxin reductase component